MSDEQKIEKLRSALERIAFHLTGTEHGQVAELAKKTLKETE